MTAAARDGLVIVDKPAGWTSHDVVARFRRLAGTRRVGHAGTLDPMATGVLVLGVGAGTRLLGHLALADKAYAATIRLGQATSTDDAQGEARPGRSTAGLTENEVRAALAGFRGEIDQVPSSFSAVKVGGQRAYRRARAGAPAQLPARRVTVTRFAATGFTRPAPGLLDVQVEVECGSGTYVRALARDLGARLRVGGHLTALRRVRVGPFSLDQARTLAQLAELPDPVPVGLTDALRAALPVHLLADAEARELFFGRPVDARGRVGTYGALTASGDPVAVLRADGTRARPVLVFPAAGRYRNAPASGH